MGALPDTDPPPTEPDPDVEEERTRREINHEALAAHEAALAIWADTKTPHDVKLADVIPNLDEIIARAEARMKSRPK